MIHGVAMKALEWFYRTT